MDEGKKKIILPEDLQIEMLKFFLETSIPRKKMLQEQQKALEQSTSEITDGRL